MVIILKGLSKKACPACGCDPCDCGWGTIKITCSRCGSDDCWCHWGDQ